MCGDVGCGCGCGVSGVDLGGFGKRRAVVVFGETRGERTRGRIGCGCGCDVGDVGVEWFGR